MPTVNIENSEQNRAWETATSASDRYVGLDRQYIGGISRHGKEGSKLIDTDDRKALRTSKAGHTALTRGFKGRLARGIRNRLMEELNRHGTEILPYPLQRGLVRNLATPAEAAGPPDLLPLWAGQSANLSACTDVSAFLTSLVEMVSEIAGPVIDWSASRRQMQSNSQRMKKEEWKCQISPIRL
jgi:hypothetical protein